MADDQITKEVGVFQQTTGHQARRNKKGSHHLITYDDQHKSTGRFDFVLANPPFNVNAVDKERLSAEVGPKRRYPFGLPRTDNANYLWIQLFYSALNETGRAGFVMANSAAGGGAKQNRLQVSVVIVC